MKTHFYEIISMGLISIFSTLYSSCTDTKPGMLSAPGYHVIPTKVFFNAGFGSGPALEVIGADPRSFEKLNRGFPESSYGRDKNLVYYNGKVIKGADSKSFTRLRTYYSMDDRFVYYNGTQLSRDPDHFVFIDDMVQKDRKHVYRGGWIISDDPENFQFITAIDGFSYYRDHKGVLVNSTRLPGANPETFKALRYGYSHDSSQVYQVDGMIAKVIEGAIPSGFAVFNTYYSHDTEHVFWKGKTLPGADPATFAILNTEVHCSRDARHAYHLDKMIPGLNPESFPAGKDCKYCTDKELVFE